MPLRFPALMLLATGVLGLLSGCGATQTPRPEIRTVTVNVPVSQPCVPSDLLGEPTYPDTDDALRAAPDAAERYRLVAAGRLLRISRNETLETVAKGCSQK